MKPAIQCNPKGRSGLTLVEVMVAMAVFSLLMMALISSHLMGLRMLNITATKLSASSGARQALQRLRDEIRSGKMLNVGSGNRLSFTNSLEGSPRQGNALQIYSTTDTNSFVRYYLNPSRQQLERVTSGSSQVDIVAQYITNQVVFRAEDCVGNVLTNDQNNRVIGMTLQFYQWEFPVARVGVDAYYDYYTLRTRMSRRAIE